MSDDVDNPRQKGRFRTSLEVAERIVVIVASAAAIVPLWQWYSESDDRRIERVVNLAIAGQACDQWAMNHALQGGGGPQSEDDEESIRFFLAPGMRIVCNEMAQSLFDDPEVEAEIQRRFAPGWSTWDN